MRRALCALAALCSLAATPASHLSLDVRDARLNDVLALLSLESGRNIVADASVPATRMTLHLADVGFDEALAVIVRSQNLLVRRVGDTLVVGAADAVNRTSGGEGPLASATDVLPLRHADPDEIAKELGVALPAGTVIVADRRTNAVVVSAESAVVARAKRLVEALDAPATSDDPSAQTRVYPLRFRRADDALKLIAPGLPPGATAVADDAQNALVVRGGEDAQEKVRALTRDLDVPALQVEFEVRVADVTPLDDASSIGLEWGGLDLQGQPLAGAAAYAFAKGRVAINARLDALVSRGRAQILATPRLVTLNNREADLLIGQTYPIVYSNSAFGGQQIQFVDVGVKLRLTPTIGLDGSVTTEIHPEYSEIEGFAAGDLPIIANRKIDSTLRVRSDQTIVLGGLMRDVSSETVTKVPGLGDLPVLGAFFRNRAAHHQRNEIVFLITPHVIRPGDAPPEK